VGKNHIVTGKWYEGGEQEPKSKGTVNTKPLAGETTMAPVARLMVTQKHGMDFVQLSGNRAKGLEKLRKTMKQRAKEKKKTE